MAQFTFELREIIENGVDIFDFDYELFDPLHKGVLEEKIINHYYFREIGVETVGRFLFNLKTRMNEILTYYNPLYVTTLLEQRILDNYDVTETFTKTNTDTGTVVNETIADANITTTDKKLFSDTPQTRVTVGTGEFITTINEDSGTDVNHNETNANATTTAEGNENWTRTMKGNIGIQTDADAVEKYRSTLINVDMLVINELKDLFMQVY